MSETNLRPSVTISTYSTLKRIERQQKQAGQNQESATRSELSTDFFKVSLGVGAPGPGGAWSAFKQNQKGRQQSERGRILIDLSQIRGPTGSVRGHKNVVKRSLEGIKMAYSRRSAMATEGCSKLSTFMAPSNCNNGKSLGSIGNLQFSSYSPMSSLLPSLNSDFYRHEYLERIIEEEQELCVAYTTTLGVIRRTFEDSKIMKLILNLNLIKYEERDIYLNQEYKFQLKIRLDSVRVPALFVDGQHIGGVEELEVMNENGDLQKLLAKFKMSKATKRICMCCGNARFIACLSCNGSRKSTIHHFKFNSIALRCIKCDKNDGLIMCPACCGPNDASSDETSDLLAANTDSGRPTTAASASATTTTTTIIDENNNAPVEGMEKMLVRDVGGEATSKC